MEPNIELSKTRDFGEIIADSFLFIKQNFKPLLSCFFVFCGFFLLAGLFTGIMQQIRVSELLDHTTIDANTVVTPASRFSHLFEIDTLLAGLFSLLTYVAMPVAILSFMALYKQKGNIAPTNPEVWAYFKYYFFKILGSSILNFLLLMIGLVFCIIPGIYFYPILSLIFPIIIVENTSYGYAFNQSFKLIKENWWLVFGALFIVTLIVGICGSIVNIPFSAVSIWSIMLHQVKHVHLSLISIILGTIMRQLSHVLHILPLVTLAICYYSLNEEKESTGLMGRIDQLGGDHADTNPPAEEY